MAKTSLEDFFKHSFILYTDEAQLNHSLDNFKACFNGLHPIPLKGYTKTVSRYKSLPFFNPNNNCVYGHMTALQIARFNRWPFVSIFEQDAWIHPCNAHLLENALADIPDQAEVVVLGMVKGSKIIKTGALSAFSDSLFFSLAGTEHFDDWGATTGAHAYLVLGPHIDSHMANVISAGLPDKFAFTSNPNCFFSSRQIFIQKNLKSVIGTTLHKCDDYIPIRLHPRSLEDYAKVISSPYRDYCAFCPDQALEDLSSQLSISLPICDSEAEQSAAFLEDSILSAQTVNLDVVRKEIPSYGV